MISKLFFNNQVSLRKFIAGITAIMFLSYMISCGSEDITLPSSNVALDPIKGLTLNAVSEDSITLDWDLLKTEEGVADDEIAYTVYAEADDGEGVFIKIPDTETVYTLDTPKILGGRRSIILRVDDTRRRTAGVTVANLTNYTLYRVVVEARDISGNTSRSELLAYTASALANPNINGVEVSTDIDSDQVAVSWWRSSLGESYLIQASEEENQLGKSEPVDNNILMVVCPPKSLLCESEDQFAQEEKNGKLKYVFQVNKKGVKYKLVIVPFNFHDLRGMQVVDTEGRVRTFTEEVLAQIKDETSVLSRRLKDTLTDSYKAQEFQIKVSIAEAPTDLVMESTGSTLSAYWRHGEGAEYYYAIIFDNNGVYLTAHTIDRYETISKFTGGEYTVFSNLSENTAYTVTVQSLTVINNVTNVGGAVSATLSTKGAEDILTAPEKIVEENLILTSDEAGELGITWNTPEASSIIGYNVFYWVGDNAPNKPQYVGRKGDTNLIFTVQPGSYNVRIDALSIYPGEEVVAGENKPIRIYGKPLAPKDLGVNFSRGVFTNIDNKLYAIGYPLSYTEAKTLIEAGGPTGEVAYYYRYQVEGGEWVGYNKIMGEAMISLQVDSLSNTEMIRSGYGKAYQVEAIASNAGGFVSEVETFKFTYQSFPEPFIHSNQLQVETGDQSLRVAWPEVSEANGSTVSRYTVTLNRNPYVLPIQSITTSKREVFFRKLENNQPHIIMVIPNSAVAGNIFTALSSTTGYTIGSVIEKGSLEEEILTAYIGIPKRYTPQGAPGAVVNLSVAGGRDQATVTWEELPAGSYATSYLLEYLTNVKTQIYSIDSTGDYVAEELSGLSWEEAISMEVATNETGSYSQIVDGLNVLSATNVFRVKGIHVDTSGKEWSSAYRYYALGTDASQPPSTVGKLTFSEHSAFGSFKVSWTNPDDPGQNENGVPARLVGYKVSWGATEELGNSFDIGTDTLSYTITGVTPGTQYYVKVQAKNNNRKKNINHGSIGFPYTVRVPGMVVSSTIAYSKYTTTSFKVSWSAITDFGYGPEGKFTSVGYLLKLSTSGGEWQSIARKDYSATEESFTGLTPGTGYQIRIIATNGASLYGTFAQGEKIWTRSLPGMISPYTIVFSRPTFHSIDIKWAVPKSGKVGGTSSSNATTLYKVEIFPDGDHDNNIFEQDNYSSNAITVTGLTKLTTYRVRITAKNIWGAALATTSYFTGTTLDDVPAGVEDLNVDSVTSSRVVLSWSPPSYLGTSDGFTPTTLSGYVVKYKKTSDKEFIEIDEKSEGVRLKEALTGTSTTVIGLSASTSYTFLVAAVNSVKKITSDAHASKVEQLMVSPAPKNLAKQLDVCSQENTIDLIWDSSPRATSYKLYRNGVEIPVNIISTNYTDTGLTPGSSYTYKVKSCNSSGCSDDSLPLTVATLSKLNFRSLINSGRVPTDLSGYDQMSRDIFSPYKEGAKEGASLVVKYVKKGSTGDGSSLKNAAGNPRIVLQGITDASEDKIYVMFIDEETYRPGGTMAMKNNVAIVGGVELFNGCLEPSNRVPTLNGENTYQLFNNRGLNRSALLYGIKITLGYSDGEGGGGMYNWESSPTLIDVTFSENNAKRRGGGMQNLFSSSPTLTRVTFSSNKAGIAGGAMYNLTSSPILSGVTFSENRAIDMGGAIYSFKSSSILVGVTFFKNRAFLGSAIFNSSGKDVEGPLIINSILWGGQKIHITEHYGSDVETIQIYNSIVEGGTGNLVSGEKNYTTINQGGFVSSKGSTPVVIHFNNIITTDPQLGELTDNGGLVETFAIPKDSSAANQGLYMKRKGDRFTYYSKDNLAWYSSPTLSGNREIAPADAKIIIGHTPDATGYTRTDRPDLGAYESR